MSGGYVRVEPPDSVLDLLIAWFGEADAYEFVTEVQAHDVDLSVSLGRLREDLEIAARVRACWNARRLSMFLRGDEQ